MPAAVHYAALPHAARAYNVGLPDQRTSCFMPMPTPSKPSCAGAALFLREFLANPRDVGSIWPSSRRLAWRMARAVPLEPGHRVVELGAGTGAVTEALLQRGLPPARLVVVERSAELVAHLRRRFPGVRVIHGDAADLVELLGGPDSVDSVVSSLPLRSLPPRQVAAIVRAASAVLAPGGRLIQFSYRLARPGSLSRRFLAVASGLVWSNLPPARVAVFVNRGAGPLAVGA